MTSANLFSFGSIEGSALIAGETYIVRTLVLTGRRSPKRDAAPLNGRNQVSRPAPDSVRSLSRLHRLASKPKDSIADIRTIIAQAPQAYGDFCKPAAGLRSKARQSSKVPRQTGRN